MAGNDQRIAMLAVPVSTFPVLALLNFHQPESLQ